jgi:hypothetical protein
MKKCPTCSNENADSMRFCLQCGTPLPDAPMVVDLGGGASQGGQSNYGNTMETQVSNRGSFQQNFQQPQQQSGGFQNPPQFSNLPPSAPKKSKTWLVIGGIAALLFLIFSAGAAVIGYNIFVKPSPTPVPTPTASTSPSSSASTSPSKSPTKSPTPDSTSTPRTNTSGMSASLTRMWIDYNVTEGGRKGMKIHVSYKVYGMKGVPSYLALYFEKQNGDKLYSNSTGFKSADGTLALYKEMDPAYDPAVYDDTTLFMPYDEIDLPPGKYNLKISPFIIFKEGGEIDRFKEYPFEFEYK